MNAKSAAVAMGAMLVALGAGTGAAPRAASVSGQVVMQERAGEVTEDIGNVVVFLTPTAATPRARPLSPTNTDVALRSRQFAPRIRVITEGSKVTFKNEDSFSHNVFSKVNGGFDTGVYGRGKARDQSFKSAGVYPIYCNVHPRMTAFIISLNTPFYTQGGADGRFVLENVPPGQYTLHVWHDRATEFTKDITVGATSVPSMRIEMDARGYKYVQHKDKNGKDYTNAAGDRY